MSKLTVGRCITEGSAVSARDLLTVYHEGRKVFVEDDDVAVVEVWPDEAVKLGLALIQAGTAAGLA